MNIPSSPPLSGSPLPSPSIPASPSASSRFSLGSLMQRRQRSNTANGSEYFPNIANIANIRSSSRSRNDDGQDSGGRSRSQSASSPLASPSGNLNIGSWSNAFLRSSSSGRSLPGTPTDQAADPLNATTPTNESTPQPVPVASTSSESSSARSSFVRLVPHLEVASRSLHFEPVNREVKIGSSIKIGRFNDRGPNIGPNDVKSPRVAFKSKVVSRSHAEISCDGAGNFWVKDTKSSSGTFLNHIRLSAPGLESRLYQVKDGDVLQLGVDYQGGTEEMYRCVKMKVELNRSMQKTNNQFNLNAMKQLRALGAAPQAADKVKTAEKASADSSSYTDCCICLFAVTVCQALFIAPCSHVYHFKCIRPLLTMHHPGFSCPLCRTFADLEADVETEEDHLLEEEAMAADGTDSDEMEVEEVAEQADQEETEVLSPRPERRSDSRRSSTSAHSRRLRTSSSEAPDSGQFQADIRRASISISGPHGEAFSLPITGRSSRPSSIRGFDMSNRTLSPMTSTNGLRDPSSSFMSAAPTAVGHQRADTAETARPEDFSSTIVMDDMNMDDVLSNQTPANSSLLSTVLAAGERIQEAK